MVYVPSLRSRTDFQALFRRGRRTESMIFRMIWIPNRVSHPRFAFVTPRTISKSSVARNRIRRRAREWIRTHPLHLDAVDTVFIFKKEAITISRRRFYEELERAIQRITPPSRRR